MFKRENQLSEVTHEDVHHFMQQLGSEGITYDEFYNFRTDREKMKVLGRTIRTVSRLFKDEKIVGSLNKFLSEKGMDLDLVELLLIRCGWRIEEKNGLRREDEPVFEYIAKKQCGSVLYKINVVLKTQESINRIFKKIACIEITPPGSPEKILTLADVDESTLQEILENPALIYSLGEPKK